MRRSAVVFAIVTIAVGFGGRAGAADPVSAKMPSWERPRCAGEGAASRVHVSVRPKDLLAPTAITATSDVWTVTKVVPAPDAWVVRLKGGPVPVPASVIHVITPLGTADVSVPPFAGPCPEPPPVPLGANAAAHPTVAGITASSSAAPARASSSNPIQGFLPLTGISFGAVPIGVICLALGALLIGLAGRPRRRDALRYDGRFLAPSSHR